MVLWFLATLALGANPTESSIEGATAAMAEGRPQAAMTLLRRVLGQDPNHEVRCLLGRAALRADRPGEALTVLAEVPDDAACARVAISLRAQALAALDRIDESAALYEALGARTLGEERHRDTAERLVTWARKTAPDHPDHARRLLQAALQLDVSDARRVEIARILAPHNDRAAAPILARAIARSDGDSRQDRLLLAPLVPLETGLAVLAPLDDAPEVLALRARLAAGSSFERALIFARRLIDLAPKDEATAALRLELGIMAATQRQPREAEELLAPLVEGTDERAADATWGLARLAALLRHDDAEKRVLDALERFPTQRWRSEAESLLTQLRLDRARAETDPAALRALAAAQGGDVNLSLEAALAASGTARLDALTELAARWPGTPAARDAIRARVDLDPEGGWAWLEAQAAAGRSDAAAIRAELDAPALLIRSPGRQARDPKIELSVRGIERLEMRLHRIDLDGFVRGGRSPDDLETLDVGIIAPDQTWTAELGEAPPGRTRTVTVDVPPPGPGLYAITAALPDREARTLLLVSDIELVARTVGGELLAIAVRDGEPVPRARILTQGERAVEGRADGSGLARLKIDSGRQVVLARTKGGPAMLAVDANAKPATSGLTWTVDLDRPVYRPGDTVRFRAVGLNEDGVARGAWRVELKGRHTHQTLRLDTDRFGAVHGEFTLPLTHAGQTPGAYALHALAPGEDQPKKLADVHVEAEVEVPRAVAVALDEDGARIAVRDAQDMPVVGQAVQVESSLGDEQVLRTDATGAARLDAPPAGLSWQVGATLPGSGVGATAERRFDPPRLTLAAPSPVLTPEQSGRVTLDGAPGDGILRIVRNDAMPERPKPIAGPEPLSPESISAYTALDAKEASSGVHTTVHEVPYTLTGERLDLELPRLDPGRYTLIAVRRDGRSASLQASLRIEEGPAVLVDEAPQIGADASFGISEGWALLTAESGGLIDAAIVRANKPWQPRLDERWHDAVDLVATHPAGVTHQRLNLDAALQVELDVQERGDDWTIAGTVTDASGAPVIAQVVVRAVDSELIAQRGAPLGLRLGRFVRRGSGAAFAAVASTLTGASSAQPIAASLLQEAARQVEAKRAQRARRGSLRVNEMAEMLDDDFAPEPEYGAGLGASGYGRGGGGIGGVASGALGGALGGRVAPSRAPLRGVRDSGLWRIVQTDARGRIDLTVPAPSGRATWRVEAIALTPRTVGRAATDLAPADAPRLVIDPVFPGWQGDQVQPRARVLAPSMGASVTVQVRGDASAEHALTLAADESGMVELPPLSAGQRYDVTLMADGERLDVQSMHFAIAPGAVDASGETFVALIGEPGGSPLAALIHEPDPWADDPLHQAAAGLSLVAALPHLEGVERGAAEAQLRRLVGAIRESSSPRDARFAAASLELLARAAPVLGLPEQDVREAAVAQRGVEPRSARERLDLTFARVLAGEPTPEATLGRLVREADQLTPEGRARLARLLLAAGEKPERTSIDSMGPEGFLAAASIRGIDGPSREDVLRSPPPVLGSPERASWIAVVAPLLAGRTETGVPGGFARSEQPVEGAATWREADIFGGHLTSTTGNGYPSRAPLSANGLPIAYGAGPRCGSKRDPCRILRGEGLTLNSTSIRSLGGLRATGDGQTLATTAGRFRIPNDHPHAGRPPAAIHVVIGESDGELTALSERARVTLAQIAYRSDEDLRLHLGDAPLRDWAAGLRSDVAQLRFQIADPSDPAAYVAAFEDLRDEAPSTRIDLEAIATTARAYRAAGRGDRAISLWQRALGQDALTELGVGRLLDSVSGRLASLQALREIVRRAPVVPAVEDAAFALPDRLLALAEDLPQQAREAGVTPTDVRLQAAAWDREFLAYFPKSDDAPEAGLRLATTLFELGAHEASLQWTDRLRDLHPDHHLLDRWLLLDGLANTEAGQDGGAARAFRRLASEELPTIDGRLGPSPLRDDARYGLGRLAEARDDIPEAVRWYTMVSSAVPDAADARRALEQTALTIEPVVRLADRGGTRVTLEATNIDAVLVSAFAIDLRTLFLRESGLPPAGSLRVEGLAPVWTGTRRLKAGAFPTERELALPLSGAGAWLVRFDADGARTAALIVRSDLALHATDASDRRVAARLGGRPARDVTMRALAGGSVVATETDARGVASVPRGAPTLAQLGQHYAFTDNAVGDGPQIRPGRPAPAKKKDVLQQRMQDRERSRRKSNIRSYDYIGEEVEGDIRADQL